MPDDKPGCLHCVIGEAVSARFGANASLWKPDDPVVIVRETVQGLAEVLGMIVDPATRSQAVAYATKLLVQETDRAAAERPHLH